LLLAVPLTSNTNASPAGDATPAERRSTDADPVSLSSTQSHIFCRWHGKGHDNPAYRDAFNIEATNRGFSFYDDEHYLSWPKKITREFAESHGFLTTLSNTETLAAFLATRGHLLYDTRRTQAALHTYQHAARLGPAKLYYAQFMHQAQARLLKQYKTHIENLAIKQTPRVGQSTRTQYRNELAHIDALNRHTQRQLQRQLRPGQPQLGTHTRQQPQQPIPFEHRSPQPSPLDPFQHPDPRFPYPPGQNP